MLLIKNLSINLGSTTIVKSASLKIGAGEAVAVIGGNGAGKTTLARGIVGLEKFAQGEIAIYDDDRLVDRLNDCSTWQMARKGILYLPERGLVWDNLTVDDNLRLSFSACDPGRRLRRSMLNQIYGEFPLFRLRSMQRAGTLSGGERRILGIARCLLLFNVLKSLDPVHGKTPFRLLILDEVTSGLSPISINMVEEVLYRLSKAGIAILLVEQIATFALRFAHRGYVMRQGSIVLQGSAEDLIKNPDLAALYLGVTA